MKISQLLIFWVFAFSFLSSCSPISYASMTDDQRKEIESYVKIVEAPNNTKSELFAKVNTWAVENFNKADAVIEFADKETGTIAGKYVQTLIANGLQYKSRSTVKIEVKDNRARITIKDPMGKAIAYPQSSYKPVETKEGADAVLKSWYALVKSLAVYLNQEEEEW